MRFDRVKAVALTLGLVVVAGVVRGQDAPSPLEGKPAPAFAAKTIEGQTVTLADQKGKVVLLDFWATWCPPCKKSLPHIQKLSQDKERIAKGLTVWAANAAEEAATVKAFLSTNQYTFTVPMAAQEQAQAWGLESIPMTVIVGRDGVVKKVIVGYDDGSDAVIEQAIDDALKAPK